MGGEEVFNTPFVCNPDHEHKIALAVRSLLIRLPEMWKGLLGLGDGGRHLGVSIFDVTLVSVRTGGEQRRQNCGCQRGNLPDALHRHVGTWSSGNQGPK